jgi:hypothetical protein
MAGLFDNLSNMFRPTQQVVVSAAPPMAQVNPGAGAPVPPAGSALPNAEVPPPNVLDSFTPLWQTDPNAPAPVDPLAAPLFNSDPSKIAAAAGKMNFTQGLTAEMVTAAMQDPAKFLQVINMVGQQAVAAATQVSTASIEQAHARNNERFTAALPARIRATQIDGMQSENPALQHPASQPLLHMVRAQIAAKEPSLTATQVQAKAEQYLTGFATQLNAPTAAQVQTQQAQGETDWSQW